MNAKKGIGVLKVKLSKVTFPEVCPACLEDAEDLISMEVWSDEDKASTTFSRADQAESALSVKKGATVIWVPTCMSHGSKNVRTTRKVVLAWIGFLILWYPGIYFLLGLIRAFYYSNSILLPLLQFLVMLGIMGLVLLYGYFPRAVERNLHFLDVDIQKDTLYVLIGKQEYYDLFLELNEMHAEEIDVIE
ncbi:MAG: hypothetical protein BAJATHORv1_70013 [Candidatus Thorarchaeota archaeon]|nr:MAG: hypothetical protein BAJATHORv1_70013 [Candidatus Thorarchaeota archaeon]